MNIGLAQELQERGNEVLYCVGLSFKDYIEKHGLRYRQLKYPESSYPLHTYSVCLSSLNAFKELMKDISDIKKFNPNCIITTFDGLPGILLAKYLKIPLVIINPFVMNNIFWKKFWEENSLEKFRGSIDIKLENNIRAEYIKIADSIERDFHLKMPRNIDDCIFGNNVDTSDVKRVDLIANSKYFLGPLGSDSDKYNFIGTMTRKETHRKSEDYICENDPTIPLVFISLGTVYCNNQTFLNTCFEALGDLDVQVMYTLANSKLDIKKAPKNFLIKSFVPQLEILNNASVFITHGGINSIHESILRRVPTIICPQGYDEFIIAERMSDTKSACVIRPEDISAEEIRLYVNQILGLQCKNITGLEILAKSFEESGGVSRAADIVEKVL